MSDFYSQEAALAVGISSESLTSPSEPRMPLIPRFLKEETHMCLMLGKEVKSPGTGSYRWLWSAMGAP